MSFFFFIFVWESTWVRHWYTSMNTTSITVLSGVIFAFSFEKYSQVLRQVEFNICSWKYFPSTVSELNGHMLNSRFSLCRMLDGQPTYQCVYYNVTIHILWSKRRFRATMISRIFHCNVPVDWHHCMALWESQIRRRIALVLVDTIRMIPICYHHDSRPQMRTILWYVMSESTVWMNRTLLIR